MVVTSSDIIQCRPTGHDHAMVMPCRAIHGHGRCRPWRSLLLRGVWRRGIAESLNKYDSDSLGLNENPRQEERPLKHLNLWACRRAR